MSVKYLLCLKCNRYADTVMEKSFWTPLKYCSIQMTVLYIFARFLYACVSKVLTASESSLTLVLWTCCKAVVSLLKHPVLSWTEHGHV